MAAAGSGAWGKSLVCGSKAGREAGAEVPLAVPRSGPSARRAWRQCPGARAPTLPGPTPALETLLRVMKSVLGEGSWLPPAFHLQKQSTTFLSCALLLCLSVSQGN